MANKQNKLESGNKSKSQSFLTKIYLMTYNFGQTFG